MSQSSKPKSRKQRVTQHHETHHHVHEAPRPERTEQHVYHHRDTPQPETSSPSVTENVKLHPRTKSEAIVLMCAVIVFAVWAFRSLYEYGKTAVKAQEAARGNPAANFNVKELVGLSPHAPHPYQFLVGWGFVFFILAIGATAAPKLASTFAVLVAVGSTIANGLSVFSFVNTAVTETTSIGFEPARSTVHPSKTEHKENQKPATHGVKKNG